MIFLFLSLAVIFLCDVFGPSFLSPLASLIFSLTIVLQILQDKAVSGRR